MGDLSRRGPLGMRQPKAVSDPIRDSARGEECTLGLECCNHDPETTIFAHLRFFSMCGMGQKPPDYCGAYTCHACHDALDGRTDVPWGWDDVLRALMKTHRRLYAKGLLYIKGGVNEP